MFILNMEMYEVSDDGCGMDLARDINKPGRLDKFLDLGFSGIVGIEADEFSWQRTWTGRGRVLHVVVEEPWEAIEKGGEPLQRIKRAQL